MRRCDILLVLQFWWFSLLLKAAHTAAARPYRTQQHLSTWSVRAQAAAKKMRTGTLDDVRSDDEDEVEEPAKKEKTKQGKKVQ